MRIFLKRLCHYVRYFYYFQAIACYHGLAALGWALGDDTMRHIGQITLATEIRSVRHYWHVRSYNSHIFPQYIRNYGTIGKIIR